MTHENSKSQKKLRFNLVDAIIVLLIISVGIFAVKFFSDRNSGGVTSQNQVRLTFYGEEVADYVIANTKVGDTTYDLDAKLNLGSVADLTTDTAQTYVEDADGNMVLGPKENYSSVYISVDVTGTLTDNGVLVNGVLYGVGHSVVLYAGYGKYYIKVFSIETLA